MKVLIVYDSVFGNTEKVALAMKDALTASAEVNACRVGDLKTEMLQELDILIVGSPTRGFSPTPAITKWIKGLPTDRLSAVKVAAFDTRVDTKQVDSKVLTFMVNLFGYAAEPIEKKLVKKGGNSVAKPAGFIVLGTEGPLQEGELERAVAWSAHLVNG